MGKGGKSGKKRREDHRKEKITAPTAVVRRPAGGDEIVVPSNEALERVEMQSAVGSGKTGDNALVLEARKFGITTVQMIAHVVAVLFFIGLGVAAHFIIKDMYGDPKVLDRIPIRYALELADVAIILTLAVVLIRSILGLSNRQQS